MNWQILTISVFRCHSIHWESQSRERRCPSPLHGRDQPFSDSVPGLPHVRHAMQSGRRIRQTFASKRVDSAQLSLHGVSPLLGAGDPPTNWSFCWWILIAQLVTSIDWLLNSLIGLFISVIWLCCSNMECWKLVIAWDYYDMSLGYWCLLLGKLCIVILWLCELCIFLFYYVTNFVSFHLF